MKMLLDNKRNKEVIRITYVVLLISILFHSRDFAQYINKGMWYHQQPTSQADSDMFFGGKDTYEGWCGPSALAIIFHYFIPNVHKILYDKYGPVDYHSSDNRGGLTSSDPYCYNSSTTYPFGDFLAHQYLGYHVTKDGVGYSGLKTIINGLDNDLANYTADCRYIQLNDIRNFLDNGYLIVINTIERHYITIAGWEGNSATDFNQCSFYIWDGWKSALGMESYTNHVELVGNAGNPGTAQNISVYSISGNTLTAHFRDQVGDGSVLAVKFNLNTPSQRASQINSKGIFATSETIYGGLDNFINNLSSHGITDIYFLVKDTDGDIILNNFSEAISKAHNAGIKIHAWLNVLNDKTAAASGNYSLSGDTWIDARDIKYRNTFINNIVVPLCSLDIDGILLDCLRYPFNANIYTGAEEAITNYVSMIKKTIEQLEKPNIVLNVTILPRDTCAAMDFGQNVQAISSYSDLITILAFTHNYFESPMWVGYQIKYFNNLVNPNCKVLTGLQAFDDNSNFTTPNELQQCIDFSYENGSSGIVLYCYPLKSWQWELIDNLLITGLGNNDEVYVPDTFLLFQNYPNPFNPRTVISFHLYKSGSVHLKIYDILGKEVSTLVNDELSEGSYKYNFNALELASNVYFYKLTLDNYSSIKKMILIK